MWKLVGHLISVHWLVLLVCPKAIACGADLSFTPDFFSTCEISEMRGPTGVKFCMIVSNRPYFIMPVQNFGARTQKKFRGQKHAKFGLISDDLEVRQRISPKMFKIGFLLYPPWFLPRYAKQVRWSLVQWPWRSRFLMVPTESAYFGRPYFGP